MHISSAVHRRLVHSVVDDLPPVWQVFIIHRRDKFRASKIMQSRTLKHPKIEVVWSHVAIEAYGNEKGYLAGLKLQSTKDGSV